MLKYEIPFDKIKTKKVLLQVPEGLLSKINDISEEFKKRGFEVYISVDPCFGACDLKFMENCTTVHFGHDAFYDAKNVVYVPVYEDFDNEWLLKTLEKYNNFDIYTTVQFYKDLKSYGYDPIKCLGCKVFGESNKENALFVGTGTFHPRGISWILKRDVFCVDPVLKKEFKVKFFDLYRESEIRKFKASRCKSFGIVVSTKPGQKNLKLANEIKEICNGDILILENITPDRLDYLPYDGYIITACPRIVIDDWKNYKKPIILPSEFYELFN